jgi:hypothetical protein
MSALAAPSAHSVLTGTGRILEIEVNNPQSLSYNFIPLGITVRGAYHLVSVLNRDAMALFETYGVESIPGQRLGFSWDESACYVEDGLYDPPFENLRRILEKKKWQLPERLQRFESVHVPSVLFWMGKAIQPNSAGKGRTVARITKGTADMIPKDTKNYADYVAKYGEKPRLSNLRSPMQDEFTATENAVKDLRSIVEAQSNQIAQQGHQIAELLKVLTAQAATNGAAANGAGHAAAAAAPAAPAKKEK